MAKYAPDEMIDAALKYVGDTSTGCDRLIVCSGQPTTYAEATTVYDLATATLTPASDFAIADDTSGRKLTISAKSGITIDHSGNATHVALCKSGDSTLRYVTTCTPQDLVSGGTVDTPEWTISIADPT